MPYWTLARFGKWDAILKEPAPPKTSPFLQGAWHYVRGLAFVAKGQLAAADKELLALRAGGVLTLLIVGLHRARKRERRPEIPYGVAIAFGGLAILTQRFLNQFA